MTSVRRNSFEPVRRSAACVCHRHDNAFVAVAGHNDEVRKSFQSLAPNVMYPDIILVSGQTGRSRANDVIGRTKFAEEIVAEAGTPIIVPERRDDGVVLRFRQDTKIHGFLSREARWLEITCRIRSIDSSALAEVPPLA